MRREPTAIYIGDHKIGYRGLKDGVQGFLYMKGDEQVFEPYDVLIKDLYLGPQEIVNTKNKQNYIER